MSVRFNPTTYTTLEGDSSELTIVRMGDAEQSFVVTVTTTDGSATGWLSLMHLIINDDSLLPNLAGDDYTQLDGVEVTFDPGEFTQTVTLNTLTDVPAEGNEDLTATLTVTDTRVTVSDSVATVTITESGRFICCSMDSLVDVSFCNQLSQHYPSLQAMLWWEREMAWLRFVLT